MRQYLVLATALAAIGSCSPLEARTVVDASKPTNVSVTVYRDPSGGEINQDWPEGFAMISETRQVTLPAGESTIRFDGVSEGMVGVSAIVTGLPGGTIEKNRNAELLSPAALVNGALGNRVTITRTNPATGTEVSESAIVRTRADGGLVLQSGEGFEAVRCAGLPERLTFDSIPDGLSAKPVFSIDTRDASGGTYEVTLTYLSWGFDWQASYVATLSDRPEGEGFAMDWLSWLTVLNNNGQSFDDAELLVVAGTLNIESDFEGLAEPPVASPLRLTCYPIGSTATGSPIRFPPPPAPPPPPPMMAMQTDMITVTASRRSEGVAKSAAAVMEAGLEQLGDLKLYRVPERVNVSAQSLKQVAFLNRQNIEGRLLYENDCDPWTSFGPDRRFYNSDLLLVTKNEEEKGLGIALPQGEMAIFEPSAFGLQLVGETDLRDYARGQDLELSIGDSAQVTYQCGRTSELDPEDAGKKWSQMALEIRNANPHPVSVRVLLGRPGEYEYRIRGFRTRVKDGYEIFEVTAPANDTLEIEWRTRLPRDQWDS